MKLAEYVLQQTMTGETDMELITRYITSENLQDKALMIIPALAADRINKINTKYENIRSWAPYVMGLKIKNKRGTLTDNSAHYLEVIILMSLCDIELEKTSIYEWAKENIPKMKIPIFFFRPAIDYLAKYGIHFEDEDEINN